ncbi:MAG: SDR family oxidoreductase [Agitococcus sp.]|nr:SDR family oxidoreductase [Agitococcus sp.]
MQKNRVLVLGASGTVGQAFLHVAASDSTLELLPASQRVLPNYTTIDYKAMTTADAWKSTLSQLDIHTVVNCVGIWSGSAELFEQVQYTVPVALFDACTSLGCALVHISALGFSSKSSLPYASTKARADEYLLQYCPTGVIILPSLIFDPLGKSSRFFLQLAALPLHMDFGYQPNLQPVHVHEVAQHILAAVTGQQKEVQQEVAGTHRIAVSDYLAALRKGMGLAPALCTITAPSWMGKAIFWLGDLAGAHFVNSQAWSLLQNGTAGTAQHPEALPYENFTTSKDLAGVRETQLYWFSRLGLAFLWLWTAFTTWALWPQTESLYWLNTLVPGLGTAFWLKVSCVFDAALGLLTLWRPSAKLWKFQMGVVAGYSFGLLWALPWALLHPFGVLTKNLAVLATLASLALIEQKRKTSCT